MGPEWLRPAPPFREAPSSAEVEKELPSWAVPREAASTGAAIKSGNGGLLPPQPSQCANHGHPLSQGIALQHKIELGWCLECVVEGDNERMRHGLRKSPTALLLAK